MVGSTIKRIRRSKNLTQNSLAEWLGVSRQAVAMWEMGKREVKIKTLEKIAHAFGVTVDEMLTLEKSIQKKKVTFELTAPKAQKVLLTGDFNSWGDGGIVMKKNKNGVWRTGVELSSGMYEYKFIVDNQWQTDPENNMKVNNLFGDYNSVVNVSL